MNIIMMIIALFLLTGGLWCAIYGFFLSLFEDKRSRIYFALFFLFALAFLVGAVLKINKVI